MLGKLLVTLIVGGIIYFLWRKQQDQNNSDMKDITQGVKNCLPAPNANTADVKTPPVKLIFSSTIAIIVFATLAWAVYDWQDQRTLLEVKIITANNSSANKSGYIGIYQVYKKDLQERGFTTKDGQIIRIASSDRMEVRKLESKQINPE